MHTLIQEIEKAAKRSDVPDFRPGDTLKVHVRVTEGTRSRIQVFQGVVIRRQGGGSRETFTVRKVSYSVGVERTFPVNSPSIDKIEVVTRGDVRRAKLYYLRDLRGKAARIKEKRDQPSRARSRSAPDAFIGVPGRTSFSGRIRCRAAGCDTRTLAVLRGSGALGFAVMSDDEQGLREPAPTSGDTRHDASGTRVTALWATSRKPEEPPITVGDRGLRAPPTMTAAAARSGRVPSGRSSRSWSAWRSSWPW